MLNINAEKLADCFAPALFAFADIIKKSSECGVSCHCKAVGHAADKIVLDVEPLMYSLEVFGFVFFDPVVFPYGVLYAAGYGAGDDQALQYAG